MASVCRHNARIAAFRLFRLPRKNCSFIISLSLARDYWFQMLPNKNFRLLYRCFIR